MTSTLWHCPLAAGKRVEHCVAVLMTLCMVSQDDSSYISEYYYLREYAGFGLLLVDMRCVFTVSTVMLDYSTVSKMVLDTQAGKTPVSMKSLKLTHSSDGLQRHRGRRAERAKAVSPGYQD